MGNFIVLKLLDMAIIGNIIKGVIEAKEALSWEPNPVEEQKEVLKELLGKAKDTQFGKQYDFAAILKSDNIHYRTVKLPVRPLSSRQKFPI